jgi:hypothetical protein
LPQHRILLERLRTNIGWKQLRVALFQAKIAGSLVAEEEVAVLDNVFAETKHRLSGFLIFLGGHTYRSEEPAAKTAVVDVVVQEVEAPLQRANNPVLITSGERCFPAVHPFGVELSEHVVSLVDGDSRHPRGNAAQNFVGDRADEIRQVVCSD